MAKTLFHQVLSLIFAVKDDEAFEKGVFRAGVFLRVMASMVQESWSQIHNLSMELRS